MTTSAKEADQGTLKESEIRPPDFKKGQEEAFARDIARLQARKAEFVEKSCPACAATEATPKFTKYGFSFVTCKECQTIYMNPRPSEAVMGDYYQNSENYAYWAKYIFPASEAARREKINRPWLQRILGFCERYNVPRGHLVEVGAGFGTFAALATTEKAFGKVTAIEPTPEMAAACRERGVDVIQTVIENIQDELPVADVVTAFEVIEHLFEPKRFFEQVRRLLHPGSILVVSCPNGEGFDVQTLGAEALSVDAEHVNLFNPNSLSTLAARLGFECLEISTPGKLDAELVRRAVLEGRATLEGQAFLKQVLLDEWERLGTPFQQFLASNGLSGHMWAVFRLRPDNP